MSEAQLQATGKLAVVFFSLVGRVERKKILGG